MKKQISFNDLPKEEQEKTEEQVDRRVQEMFNFFLDIQRNNFLSSDVNILAITEFLGSCISQIPHETRRQQIINSIEPSLQIIVKRYTREIA